MREGDWVSGSAYLRFDKPTEDVQTVRIPVVKQVIHPQDHKIQAWTDLGERNPLTYPLSSPVPAIASFGAGWGRRK